MMASTGSIPNIAGWTMCDVILMRCGCTGDYITAEGDMQLSYILVYVILFGFDFAGMICAWAQTFLATMSCIGCATSHWDSLWVLHLSLHH